MPLKPTIMNNKILADVHLVATNEEAEQLFPKTVRERQLVICSLLSGFQHGRGSNNEPPFIDRMIDGEWDNLCKMWKVDSEAVHPKEERMYTREQAEAYATYYNKQMYLMDRADRFPHVYEPKSIDQWLNKNYSP